MPKVLVTGGSGLVGKALQKVVSETSSVDEWVFASSRDADFTNRDATFALFSLVKPDYVIHLAARVGGLFANMTYKVEFYRDNMRINDNVFEACRHYNVKKLISCLSTCIFPDKTTYPIDESMIHDGPPHSSNEGYAYAKRMIDVVNRAYNAEYGMNCTSIIPTNIYGPHDNYNLENSHVIPGLIHKCYLAKQTGNSFIVGGSGKPLRQFIYSEDLAKLILWTLKHYESTEPIILSVDEEEEVSISTVATMIADAMEYKGKIIFDTSRADGQYKKTASNKKLRSHLPEFTFIPIKDGIKKAVEWFLENYAIVRK